MLDLDSLIEAVAASEEGKPSPEAWIDLLGVSKSSAAERSGNFRQLENLKGEVLRRQV